MISNTKQKVNICIDYNDLKKNCSNKNCKDFHICRRKFQPSGCMNTTRCALNHFLGSPFNEKLLENYSIKIDPNILLKFFQVLFSLYF